MLSKTKKENAIKKTQTHKTDTGSPEVQVSVLSKKIDELANHLKIHRKDRHSRKGLLQMVADRRKHLKYLQRKSVKRYTKVIKTLGLKK
ncbi:30S ribosomal protein S15 [Patescibacteria group bacterium]|nr:30S ribosomal protein S15 [Patescibacteria group bacterium]